MFFRSVFITFLFGFASFLSAESHQPPLFSVGAGILHPSHPEVAIQLETRWSFSHTKLRPQIGIMTAEFTSLYIYGGLSIDMFFYDRFVFTPSFSPGVYFKGNSIDLGYPLEFRSAIEISYLMENYMRIGGQFYHLSNGSISNKNPGVNVVMLFIGIPFCL